MRNTRHCDITQWPSGFGKKKNKDLFRKSTGDLGGEGALYFVYVYLLRICLYITRTPTQPARKCVMFSLRILSSETETFTLPYIIVCPFVTMISQYCCSPSPSHLQPLVGRAFWEYFIMLCPFVTTIYCRPSPPDLPPLVE